MKGRKGKFTPIGVTFETLDSLFRDKESNAVQLYMAYACISHWQGQYRPKASNRFMMKRMGWGKSRFEGAKKVLVERGLIEKITERAPSGKISGWYVQINHLISDSHHLPSKPEGWIIEQLDGQGQSTLNEQLSTLNEQEVLAKKENASSQHSVLVGSMIKKFKETNPALGYANKTERRDALLLIEEIGEDKILDMVDEVVLMQTKEYAPVVTKPTQMWNKLAQVRAYLNKNSTSREQSIYDEVRKIYGEDYSATVLADALYSYYRGGGGDMTLDEFAKSSKYKEMINKIKM